VALPAVALTGLASLYFAEHKEAKDVPFYDFVLVGGGIASYMAAREIRERLKEAKVLLIGDESHSPYLRPPLSKNLWRSSDDEAATLSFRGGAKGEAEQEDDELISVWASGERTDTGVESVAKGVKGRVRAVDTKQRTVELEDGSEYAYGKLLLATGARAVSLAHIQPEIADRVLTLRTIDDWQRLRALTRAAAQRSEPLRVTVVGGGYLGTELAASLAQHAPNCRVVQLLNNELPMEAVFPRVLGEELATRMTKRGVELVPRAHAVGVVQSRGDGCSVVLQDGATRESDVVVLALGAESDVGLIARSGFEVDDRLGGVVANSELQVASNVWAAGDVVSYYDATVGVRRRTMHADHAAMSGVHAGRNMVASGGGEPYEYLPSEFGSVAGLEWEGCGLLDSRFDTVSLWDREAGPGCDRGVVYYLEDNSVVGVLTVNLPHSMDYAKKLVKYGFAVEDAKELFQLIYLGEK
jgi:NADPH-dependent 2,4-dienoyl-CoA reductase/sulfur reductase-like enzyme